MLVFIPWSGNEHFEEESNKSRAIFIPFLAYTYIYIFFFGDSELSFCSFHIYSFSRIFCKLLETGERITWRSEKRIRLSVMKLDYNHKSLGPWGPGTPSLWSSAFLHVLCILLIYLFKVGSTLQVGLELMIQRSRVACFNNWASEGPPVFPPVKGKNRLYIFQNCL